MKSIILYTTRYGSAAEVAKRIQKEIGADCLTCNIMKELSKYKTLSIR